jgi:hypothetical protein
MLASTNKNSSTLFCFTQTQSSERAAAAGSSRPLIANTGFDKVNGDADEIAYGSLYIANPDLVARFKMDAPLNKPDPSTFYGAAEPKGYTDYPTLAAKARAAQTAGARRSS